MKAEKLLNIVKTLALWLGGAVLLVLILALLAGYFTDKTQPGRVEAAAPETPAFEEVVAVRAVEQQVVERAPGTVSAVREALVSPRIMAMIGEIEVASGDRVERGQVLARLDSRDLAAREQQAGQVLAAARARLTETEREFERMRTLVAEQVIPRAQFDAAEAALQTARAEARRAEQALDESRAGASYAVIEAPFDGRIVDRYAEPGDMAMPGTPILKLYDPARMRLEAYVRESLAAGLRPGMTLAVHMDAISTTVQGRVEEIVPQAEPGSRSMMVKVALPERADLYPGMFGRLMIPSGQERRLLAPVGAIRQIGQYQFVWVVPAEGPPTRRYVKLGESVIDGWREVISGLAEGEQVGLGGE